ASTRRRLSPCHPRASALCRCRPWPNGNGRSYSSGGVRGCPEWRPVPTTSLPRRWTTDSRCTERALPWGARPPIRRRGRRVRYPVVGPLIVDVRKGPFRGAPDHQYAAGAVAAGGQLGVGVVGPGDDGRRRPCLAVIG